MLSHALVRCDSSEQFTLRTSGEADVIDLGEWRAMADEQDDGRNDEQREEQRDEPEQRRKKDGRFRPTTDNFSRLADELAEVREREQARLEAERVEKEREAMRAEIEADIEADYARRGLAPPRSGDASIPSLPAVVGVPGLPAAATALSKSGRPSQWAVDIGYVGSKLPAPAIVLAVLFAGLWWLFKQGIL